VDLVKDQLTRRQLVDNTTRNLLRLMSAACGVSDMRLLSSQRLETWLQNPKVGLMISKLGLDSATHGLLVTDLQALKYRSVMDIVQPICEIVRRREETTGHSV
jgi:hypothetical protein